MDKQAILTLLSEGEMKVEGQFLAGSNYTFLVVVHWQDEDYPAVYKPVRGEQPLWDFPERTLAHREVAAYLVSEALGWDLVPPTVYRRHAPLGAGSVQWFVEHDPEHHFFHFTPEEKQRLRPVALFDLLTNNADRKGGHILMDAQGHIWLIDQGLCFHVEEKLRTVVWDFAGEPIPEDLLADLQAFVQRLETDEDLSASLGEHLSRAEIRALLRRGKRLLQEKVFPSPPSTRRPYPWPPV